jgi:peptidoglycan hydrolase-like protein with peptidoglycan-binding domain
VTRAARTLPALVGALLAGPTGAERNRGIVTAIPAGTRVLDLRIRRNIVTIDLSGRFAAGVDRSSLRDRAGQLVHTLLGVPGVKAVRIRVEGGVPVGLFPGYDLRRPVTRMPTPPDDRLTTRDAQELLADLGFMDRRGVTGAIDTQTSTAALGFQKWIGLPRDGIVSPATLEALRTATRPQPALRAPGRRIEVQVDRQLALLIEDGRVERTVHVSSGAYGKTPIGTFSVFRKERYSWSVPFKVWLPWASYFTGGVAFHEFGSVPTYAASHGCIRVNHYDAQLLYDFARSGTQVDVLHEARV